MLRRIDVENAPRLLAGVRESVQSEPVVAPVAQTEHEAPLLPHDHPPWVKDTLRVSQRAKEILARLRPIALRILTFWDHRIRTMSISGRRISIDPSGSYRAE